MARNAYRAIRTYQAGMDDMFSYCLSVLTETGVRIKRKDANLGRIEAGLGWHLFIGSPCRVEVTVPPVAPDQTKVTISSWSLIRTQFDWGRNKRIVGKFLETLDFIIDRIAVSRENADSSE